MSRAARGAMINSAHFRTFNEKVTRFIAGAVARSLAETAQSLAACWQPFLVLKERAARQRNLSKLTPLGVSWQRAGLAQNVVPLFRRLFDAIERFPP
jgi:hypothetical protein